MTDYVPDTTARTGRMVKHPKFADFAAVDVEEWDIDGHHATLSYIDFDAGTEWQLVWDNLAGNQEFIFDDAKKVVITIRRVTRGEATDPDSAKEGGDGR